MQDTTIEPTRVNRLPLMIGVAIFVIALAFRLVGIGWGLKNDLHNQSYHPDELENLQYSQQIDPAAGKFLPHVYNYGSLYFTLISVTSKAVSSYTGGQGETDASFWDWAARCELWGRVVGAAFGAGTAVLLFALMRRFAGLAGGTLAAAVIAIAPAHLVHSRFLTPDVFAVFWIAASAWAALRLLPSDWDPQPSPGFKYAALAGIYAGLSAGVKYTGVLALLTLYAALYLAKRPRWILEAAIGTAAALVTFVVSTPGCLLDQEAFIRDVKFEMNHVATGHGLAFVDTTPGFAYHLTNLFLGLGALLTLVCVAGLVWAGWKKQHWCWALLAFFVPYYLLIGREEVKFLRYTFPLYVALAAGFGWFMVDMHRRGGWSRLGVAIGICGLGGLDFGGLRSAAVLTAQMAGEDPRDSAMRYIRSIATPQTRVGLGREVWYWSIPIMPDNDLPPAVPMATRLQKMAADSSPPVDIVLSPAGDAPVVFSPDLVTKLHPEIIAFTSIEIGDLARLVNSKDLSGGDQSMVNHTAQFADLLGKTYKLDHAFGTGGLPVEDMEYINPQVFVWKRSTP